MLLRLLDDGGELRVLQRFRGYLVFLIVGGVVFPDVLRATEQVRAVAQSRHTLFTRWLLLSAQLERRAIFILFFLFVRIPDFFEAVLTDDMFNQAGGIFCSKQTVFRAFCMKMPGRKLDGIMYNKLRKLENA